VTIAYVSDLVAAVFGHRQERYSGVDPAVRDAGAPSASV
jgi:hypothetical protein